MRLRRSPHDLPTGLDAAATRASEEDLQLALYCLYELHYRGFAGVDAEWEWEPSLLRIRRRLEGRFESELADAVGPEGRVPQDVPGALWQMATEGAGPSLSAWVRDHASIEQLRELFIHRSAYQLKEADPHTWGIPRLSGPAKAVMVAIQADEYGAGQADQMHSTLFAATMRSVDLDPTLNGYLDLLPAWTLATTNLISLLGLHRRLRGCLVGHLALFEMTSTGPMGRYAEAMQRLGLPAAARRFYDVHVLADEQHQHMAADGMVGGLVRAEPALAADVLRGARYLTLVEQRFTERVLEAWQAGRSSLRPAPDLAAHLSAA